MEATEIRIGNWASLEGKHFELELPDILLLQRYPNQYQPIPLTEEWLEKFGFRIDHDNKEWAAMSYPCWLLRKLSEKKWGVEFWQGCELIYVHQLQNLYFALTGEELEIKNP